MSPFFVLVAAAALGIEVGWEPLPQGGHEYTIQIEPQLLDVLKKGEEEIVCEVHPHLNVRRYRITIGSGKLARHAGPAQTVAEPAQNYVTSPPKNASVDDRLQDAQQDRYLSDRSDPTPSAGQDPTAATDASDSGIPARLLDSENAATPVNHHAPEAVKTKKSAPPDQGATVEPAPPWPAFLVVLVLLCCSLGVNLYLGWVAWGARNRYRDALSKFRPVRGT